MKLLSPEVTKLIMSGDRFSVSHGAEPQLDFFGVGLLYYYLTYQTKANLAVCLGSGSGFVPKLMRQAQRDLGGGGRTILIDADVRDPQAGIPDYHEEMTTFRRDYSDVEIWKTTTKEAAARIEEKIDFLHIDADHTYEGVREDFITYFPKVRRDGFITLHDTESPRCGVRDFLRVLEDMNIKHINLSYGNGTALIRKERD